MLCPRHDADYSRGGGREGRRRGGWAGSREVGGKRRWGGQGIRRKRWFGGKGFGGKRRKRLGRERRLSRKRSRGERRLGRERSRGEGRGGLFHSRFFLFFLSTNHNGVLALLLLLENGLELIHTSSGGGDSRRNERGVRNRLTIKNMYKIIPSKRRWLSRCCQS